MTFAREKTVFRPSTQVFDSGATLCYMELEGVLPNTKDFLSPRYMYKRYFSGDSELVVFALPSGNFQANTDRCYLSDQWNGHAGGHPYRRRKPRNSPKQYTQKFLLRRSEGNILNLGYYTADAFLPICDVWLPLFCRAEIGAGYRQHNIHKTAVCRVPRYSQRRQLLVRTHTKKASVLGRSLGCFQRGEPLLGARIFAQSDREVSHKYDIPNFERSQVIWLCPLVPLRGLTIRRQAEYKMCIGAAATQATVKR